MFVCVCVCDVVQKFEQLYQQRCVINFIKYWAVEFQHVKGHWVFQGIFLTRRT